MNKTVFFNKFRRLFGFVLAISLSASVLTAQAQNARITLNLSDVPMSQVMKEIEKQTRYLFINKGVDTGIQDTGREFWVDAGVFGNREQVFSTDVEAAFLKIHLLCHCFG